MKNCYVCKSDKTEDEFSWKWKSKGIRSGECKECHRKTRVAYYKKNTKTEMGRIKDRKDSLRKWFCDIKENTPCSQCGFTHVATLDYHHPDRSLKERDPSKMIANGWSKERILEEISSLVPLCSNCHRILHYSEVNVGKM